jgi:phosphatidylinositol alpha-1,6-mannosyltransferase
MIMIATQCFPPDFGGVENMMAGMAAEIVALRRECAVFADGAATPWDADQTFSIRRFSGWKPIRHRLKAHAVNSACRDAELLICDSWKSLEHLSPPDNLRVHCLAHGMEIPANASQSKALRITRAFAKSTKVIANSHYSADLADRFRPTPVARAIATPPIPPQPDPSKKAVERIETNAGKGKTVIAFVGRLEPRKGVDHVISALEHTPEDVIFLIAGGGPDRARLEAHAAALGLSHRIFFLGYVDDDAKAALLLRADIFAMPARREGASVEGFGIVYLEAGWYGTPSLAGIEGGARDAVLENETGLFCDGADKAAVCASLKTLIDDPSLRERLGKAAAAHARTQLWRLRIADFIS